MRAAPHARCVSACNALQATPAAPSPRLHPQFFDRMGLSKLRFKPAFNPYTEPSMEIFRQVGPACLWSARVTMSAPPCSMACCPGNVRRCACAGQRQRPHRHAELPPTPPHHPIGNYLQQLSKCNEAAFHCPHTAAADSSVLPKPSLSPRSYSEQLGKWIEVGNSGMFRPEMLRPMGLPEGVNVIAWGLGLERPTMILYK